MINPFAAEMFPALPMLDHRFGTDAFNKGVSHISQRRFPVGVEFIFHFLNGMLQQLLFILIQLEEITHQRIPFH